MARSNSYLGSVSDLMAGLMIVFLFIAISYMIEVRTKEGDAQKRAEKLEIALVDVNDAKAETEKEKAKAEDLNKMLEEQKGQILKTNETIREIAATYSEIQEAIYRELEMEFRQDLPKWNATLELDNTIRFNEPEVLFLVGEAEIRNRFEVILQDFFPRYLNIIYQERYRNEIEEVRIEGHTSSLWVNARTEEIRYLNNAELSQQRALAVLAYCFQLPNESRIREFLIRDLRANGLSFAKPVTDATGAEDPARSQRVEFRVVTKTTDRILRILEASDKKGER